METCSICLENNAEYPTECNHKYCISCLCRIKKCALCRKVLNKSKICNEIKNNKKNEKINTPVYFSNVTSEIMVDYIFLDVNERRRITTIF
jgi:hypothetical protein